MTTQRRCTHVVKKRKRWTDIVFTIRRPERWRNIARAGQMLVWGVYRRSRDADKS